MSTWAFFDCDQPTPRHDPEYRLSCVRQQQRVRLCLTISMVTDSHLTDADVLQLRTSFAGRLLRPIDERYEEVRSIWNGAIRRRPALIASCTGAADVLAALRFARDRGLEISVRGGGHAVAGHALCDGGVVIDLSPMTSVRVDPESRAHRGACARAGGGAPWSHVDRET